MEIKYLRTILILFIGSISISVFAQDIPGLPNELDNMYLPPNSSIFNNEANKNFNNNSPTKSDFKNIISFNPTMLFRQIASLEYSRILGEYVVVQGGLGLCFGPDLISTVGNYSDWSSALTSKNSNNNTVPLSEIIGSSSFSSKSLFKSISLKFITDDDWDWTYYIELNARFYSNNYTMENPNFVNTGDVFKGTNNFTITNNAYSLIFGRQVITEGNIRLSHDFFWGFGLRRASYNTYEINEVNNTTNYTTYNEYTDAANKQKIYAPSILFGYKLGFGF